MRQRGMTHMTSNRMTENEKFARRTYKQFCRYSRFKQFMSKVIIGPPDECWIWQGAVFDRGYGSFVWPEKKIQRAHVAAYVLFIGKIPKRKGKKKLYVCHSCDTPLCVNPAHLWLGTHRQNTEDKVKAVIQMF
jgi:hypothetical protein